ncbi:MAG: ABC transporter permease [Nitratireductor sp.]|nr:ABC transporter permease [Nitratireductor sp.]
MAAHSDIVRQDLKTQRRLTLPSVAVIFLFGLVPLLIVMAYSFMKPAVYGGVEPELSLEAYVSFLFQRDLFDDTLVFSADYLLIFLRTALFAMVATLTCLLIGFPTAYYMATRPESQRNRWVLLITIPFWSNLLVRTIAILFIIRDDGPINAGLMALGIIDAPLPILFSNTAIVAGLFYSFLPFMILPIYSSIERFDFQLVEAGYDLYARRWQVLRHIILPIAKPGIITGSVLVFIPAFGAYVTPLILGGGNHMMIGDLIALQFRAARNWPLGAAFSMILMAFVLILLILQIRKNPREALHG